MNKKKFLKGDPHVLFITFFSKMYNKTHLFFPGRAPLDKQLAVTGVPRTCLRPSTMAVFLDSFNKYVVVSQRMLRLNDLPADGVALSVQQTAML